MRVKVGDTWYSADDQPLACQLTDEEWAFVRSGDIPPGKSFGAGHFDTDEECVVWLREGRDQ